MVDLRQPDAGMVFDGIGMTSKQLFHLQLELYHSYRCLKGAFVFLLLTVYRNSVISLENKSLTMINYQLNTRNDQHECKLC